MVIHSITQKSTIGFPGTISYLFPQFLRPIFYFISIILSRIYLIFSNTPSCACQLFYYGISTAVSWSSCNLRQTLFPELSEENFYHFVFRVACVAYRYFCCQLPLQFNPEENMYLLLRNFSEAYCQDWQLLQNLKSGDFSKLLLVMCFPQDPKLTLVTPTFCKFP